LPSWDTYGIYVPMVAGEERTVQTTARRVRNTGVVTCVVVEAADAVSTLGELAEETLVRAGAAVVMPNGVGLVAAFRRVTDAVKASLTLRTQLPSSRMAMCTGETGAHGEFGPIADKASRLVAGADAGSTRLSKVAGALVIDHLPRDRRLLERAGDGTERYFELLDGSPVPA
jgi:hypothetical protein